MDRLTAMSRRYLLGAALVAVAVAVIVVGAVVLATRGSSHGSDVAGTARLRATSPPPSAAPCATGTVDQVRGGPVDFGGCGANARAEVVSGTGVLSRITDVQFVARAAGTAVVEISIGPPCSPGTACSNVRKNLARVTVVVR